MYEMAAENLEFYFYSYFSLIGDDENNKNVFKAILLLQPVLNLCVVCDFGVIKYFIY